MLGLGEVSRCGVFRKGAKTVKRLFFTMAGVLMLGGLLMPGSSTGSEKVLDGATVLQSRCTSCHGPGRIKKAKHDLDGWKKTVDRMMSKANFGDKLSDEELDALLSHLASQQ